MDDSAVNDRVAQVEALLGELEQLADPDCRGRALAAVGAVVELYGEGLARIASSLPPATGEALAEDELVAHLLLLHDLHPVPLAERVRGALEEVRPYMESHGGGVELVAIEGGVVKLRLEGSCSGCPSSTMTLKLAIEDAIHKAAPDVDEIVAEGVVAEPAPPVLQIELPQAAPAASPGGSWSTAGSLAELSGGGAVVKRVAGEEVLFARLDESYYAYRPGCPSCGRPLGAEALSGAELVCGGCGNHYDPLRAGRCLDQPQLHLDPVPLLSTDEGLVRVAV